MSSDIPDKARVDELFAQALDLPAHDRTHFLNEACSGDDGGALRAEIEQLLALSADNLAPEIEQLRSGELLRAVAHDELPASDSEELGRSDRKGGQ